MKLLPNKDVIEAETDADVIEAETDADVIEAETDADVIENRCRKNNFNYFSIPFYFYNCTVIFL